MVEQAARRQPAVPRTEWLLPLPPALRFVLHANAAGRAAVRATWGAEFSDVACRARVEATRATLWLGPDEYLLLDLDADADDGHTFERLEAALTDLPHALVDVSHRQFGIEIHGPHAATILRGACPLDLDLEKFPVGMCTRTVLAKADIVLWRVRTEAFRIEAWRSFAAYVTGTLSEIAREFYPARADGPA